jgi:hypothetical protein
MTQGVEQRNWWKVAWGIVAGLGVLVGLTTGVLTIRDKLAGTPTFTGTIDTTDQAASFTSFLNKNDGKRVKLNVTCTWFSTACHLPTADEMPGDSTVMALYPSQPCSDMFDCPGVYWLTFSADPSSDVQLDNGQYGAGSLVAKGSFAVVVRGQVGSTPPGVTSVDLHAQSSAQSG